MQEEDHRDRREGEDRDFIMEKIVGRPLTWRQIVRRFLLVACFGAVFGGAAAGAFAAARYVIGQKIGEAGREVSFPADTPPETEISPEESREEESLSQEELDGAVNRAMASYRFSPDNLASLTAAVKTAADQAMDGIVTITTGREDTDLFGNPMSRKGTSAGVVIADTGEYLLVLTGSGAAQDADQITVTFRSNAAAQATLRGTDQVTGFAILSVDTQQIDSSERKQIHPVVLGNSYLCKAGDAVIAVGAPTGKTWSVMPGMITDVTYGVSIEDGNAVQLGTDIAGADRDSAYLINTSGELIGLPMAADEGTLLTDMGISGYKARLEKLSNGAEIPRLGMHFQDVSSAMQLQGMPQGAYVTAVSADGPAFAAGIQNGDIVTGFGDKKMHSSSELESAIAGLTPGSEIVLSVMRAGRNGYAELKFTVTAGKR